MKRKKTEYRTQNGQFQPEKPQKGIEILTGAVLFVFGVYNSILYFGHTIIPISDFASFWQIGQAILNLQMPASFKYAPVVGILQNLTADLSLGYLSPLQAGWLLNAILHPFSVVLLWLVGKKLIGKAAAWFALIVTISPWTIYNLTEPIGEAPYLFFILLTVYLIFRRSRWAYLAASMTTMVRYEGAALILAAFVVDIVHRKDKRDIYNAIFYSVLAFVPLIVWLSMTFLSWKPGTSHYFNVLFTKEYAKGFTEPIEGRRGLMLHLNLLWQTGFQPLLIPYISASEDFAQMLLKLCILATIVGFISGCIFAILKRRWEILVLLLFFIPYFALHAWYPYPLKRFHSTIFWIAILIAWFGLQSLAWLWAKKLPPPRLMALIFKSAFILAAAAWCLSLVKFFPKAASVSPVSVSLPYVTMLTAAIIVIARLLMEAKPLFVKIPSNLCIVSVMCLVIASNQFMLAPLLGDGKREIEFKMLGEWFAANAKPNEKMAVYQNDTQLFAGKYAQNVIGFPKADSPRDLVEKLRKEGVIYVVWATREGYSHGEHTGYQQMGLNRNIAFLDKPRSVACYQFVKQIGSQRGFVNVFRLTDKGDEQLPTPEK
jgi:hypothetical protein